MCLMAPGPWYCDLHDLDHIRVIAWEECWIPPCQAHSLSICLCTCLLSLMAGPHNQWACRETVAPGPSFSSDWGDWEEDGHRTDVGEWIVGPPERGMATIVIGTSNLKPTPVT